MHKTSLVFCTHKITGRLCAFVFVCALVCVGAHVYLGVCMHMYLHTCVHAKLPVHENYRINNKPEDHRDRFTDNRACSFIV